MAVDYRRLKELAKAIRRPVTDLIALAVNNDPFYAGVPYRRRNAEWFAAIWNAHDFPRAAHPRRIHYVLVSEQPPVRKPDGEPYRNTLNDWQLLLSASLAARYLETIPFDAIQDHRNDPPAIFAPGATKAATITAENYYAYLGMDGDDFPDLPNLAINDFEPEQTHLVEIWIEKSTQNDWLVPLCQAWGVNLVVGIGELSETACRLLVGRVEQSGKAARILYLSDFDPGGRSMPVAVARKIEFHLQRRDIDPDVSLQPIILTEEQCREYELPRTPIKETERRKNAFEDRFGQGATELDALEALHPGAMRGIVDAEIERYLDPTLAPRTLIARARLDAHLREITERVLAAHEDDIEELREEYQVIASECEDWQVSADKLWSAIALELDSQRPDLADFPKPEPRPARQPPDLLFDSRRDYLTQLDAYRAWQGRNRTEGEAT